MKISATRAVIALSMMVLALPLAMDIYIPAIPSMTRLFHVTDDELQLTLTLFMLASGVMQLLVGPWADRFGRKSTGYITIICFALGTLLCGTANSVIELILFRILQAIGACGMMVVAFATVRDLFHGRESALVYSLLNGIIAFSPMFAPFLGSHLLVSYGWASTFFALLIIAILAFTFFSITLPESLPKAKRKRFEASIFKEYKTITKNKVFLIYTYATAAGLYYLFIFCFISPYLIMTELHIPALDYGYYFFFMGISFFIGSLFSAFLVKRIGIYNTVITSFFISLSGGILMTVWYFKTGLTIDNFVWPMLLIGIGGTLGLGAGSGGAMEPFGDKAGAAAAVSGFLRFAFSAVLGTIVVGKTVTTSLPLAIPAIVLNLIGIGLFLFYRKILKVGD